VNELVVASLQFPTVVFTIALGIVVAYWLFVLLGALDIDLLGGGHVDADVDLAGAAKGVGELVTGGAKAGAEVAHADAHGGGDADADADGGGVWHGLGLGDVPVTISVSLITLVSWCGSLGVMHYLAADAGWLRAIVLIAAIAIALPIVALLIRPLAPVFAVVEGKSNADYVGHTCTITTGTVDAKFGQATVEDGGTVLQIAVRCDRAGALGRGDKALIIDFDRERSAYLVEPTGDMLASSGSSAAADPGAGSD
jgi:hypothetical protein